jgi:hypothetical protein
VNDILDFFVVNYKSGLTEEEVQKRALKFGYNPAEIFSPNIRSFFSYEVIRSSRIKKVQSDKIILGDVIYLNPGDIAPANIRLIMVEKLTVNEEKITGNFAPTAKNTLTCKKIAKKAEQHNILFAGSNIINGRAMGIVVDYTVEKPAISPSFKTPKLLRLNNFIANSNQTAETLKKIDFVIFDGLKQEYEVIKSVQDIFIQKNIPCLFFLDSTTLKKSHKALPLASIIKPNQAVAGKEAAMVNSPSTTDKIKIVSRLVDQKFYPMYVYRGEVYEPAASISKMNIVIAKGSSQTALIHADAITTKTNANNLSSILYNKK